MLPRGYSIRRTRRAGIAALEFAIVTPALLAVVIAIVYYGLVLALQQVLTLAAEEGARAALRYPSGVSAANPAVMQAQRVNAAAAAAIATLPASIGALIPSAGVAQAVSCSSTSGNVCVRVTLNLTTSAILPSVPLVPVPPTLSGTAMVQLSPDT